MSVVYETKLEPASFLIFPLPSSLLQSLPFTAGLMSVLYETKLTTGEKVAGSLQMQATDLTKPIKYGFALELQ